MALRSQNSKNYANSPFGRKLASGKGRDYHSAENGPGFIQLNINPTGITAEPGNGYRYHVYLSPTTISIDGGPVEIDYLVVGGGGGAGGQYEPGTSPGSGGGGAGGMLSGTTTLSSGSYPVVIGSGGNGGVSNGLSGGQSVLASIVASGGGGGGVGYWTTSSGVGPPLSWGLGRPGGSGGGGGSTPTPTGYPNNFFLGGSGNTPPTTPPQGNPGGNGFLGTGAGGGGGAGGSGSPAPSGTAGIGRTDIRFAAPLIAPAIPAPLRPTWINLVGDEGTYASGGRGNFSTIPQGYLIGGGGAGGGDPGYLYTGGGGSGFGPRASPHVNISGGNGGPGIVVFRYLI